MMQHMPTEQLHDAMQLAQRRAGGAAAAGDGLAVSSSFAEAALNQVQQAAGSHETEDLLYGDMGDSGSSAAQTGSALGLGNGGASKRAAPDDGGIDEKRIKTDIGAHTRRPPPTDNLPPWPRPPAPREE